MENQNKTVHSTETVSNGRALAFDYLRIFATCSVIILHVASSNWGNYDQAGKDFQVFAFCDSIMRWGVPVFVMISGALFLKRDIPISKIYTKYILRLATAYVVWTFLYYLTAGESVAKQWMGLMDSESRIYCLEFMLKSHFHLWFLPMIIGLYMCLPIIRQLVANEKVTKYFLILSFIFWFLIPQIVRMCRDYGSEHTVMIVNAVNKTIGNMNMNLVMGYAFYFVLGYVLINTVLEQKTEIMIYLLGMAGFVFTIIFNGPLPVALQKPVGNYYDYYCVNVLFEAVAVFVLFQRLFGTKKNIALGEISRAQSILLLLSKWSFGVYLVHAMVIELLDKYWGMNSMTYPAVVSMPVISAIVLVVSYLVSAVLNKLPIVGKYIA